ncbi:MAG: heparin lyase I family protein [Desulfobacteraceae bacterium]|nr:heparin lyase I family protein [Desulfobacteraceae bacterium]
MKKNFWRAAVMTLMLSPILCSPAWATKYAYWNGDSENQTCGTLLPTPPWTVNYAYRRMSTLCPDSGNKSYGVKYDYNTYGINVINELKKVSSLPVTCQLGKTYYMAFRFRIDRINGKNVFHISGQSADKFLEMDGSGIRWLVSIGHWTGENLTPGNFSIFSGNPTYHLNPEIEQNSGVPPNANGYSWNNQPQLAYEKWHSVVAAVKMAADKTGSWEVWADGVQIYNYTNIQTAANSTPTIASLLHLGTIAQPAYDAPDHYIYFDDLMLTDNWQDVVEGAYLTSPSPVTSTSTANTAPAAPGNLRVSGTN